MCDGAPEPAAKRPSRASTVWPATVRPKRDSHILCSGSSLRITPFAWRWPFARYAPCGFDSRRWNVSLPSSWASSRIATETVFSVSPAAKLSVPLAAV